MNNLIENNNDNNKKNKNKKKYIQHLLKSKICYCL